MLPETADAKQSIMLPPKMAQNRYSRGKRQRLGVSGHIPLVANLIGTPVGFFNAHVFGNDSFCQLVDGDYLIKPCAFYRYGFHLGKRISRYEYGIRHNDKIVVRVAIMKGNPFHDFLYTGYFAAIFKQHSPHSESESKYF